MIGTYGSSAYKSADSFVTAGDYMTFLCGDTEGFFTRNTITNGRFRETFHRAEAMICRNQYFAVPDCYCSMNTFLTRHTVNNPDSGRKVNNIKHLNALYVDIDCYKYGLSPEQVLFQLQEDYYNHTIPVPTVAINSGRGLYLIWKIDEDRNALPRWKKVEDYLVGQLAAFGADTQATDAARILRVPFSINSKSGTMVSIMEYTDVRYTLHEIITEFDVPIGGAGFGKATAKQRRAARMLASAFCVPLPDLDSYDDTYAFIEQYMPLYADARTERKSNSRAKVYDLHEMKFLAALNDGRIKDLYTLFSIRKGENCCREYALFLCRVWTLETTHDKDAAVAAVLELNAALDCPFSADYAIKVTASAEKKWSSGGGYQYSNKKVVSALQITNEEQMQMIYLCGKCVDERVRRQRKNRMAYLSRLAAVGKDTKASAITRRRAELQRLIDEGYTKEQICCILGISPRTYDRDKSIVIASKGAADAAPVTPKDLEQATQNDCGVQDDDHVQEQEQEQSNEQSTAQTCEKDCTVCAAVAVPEAASCPGSPKIHPPYYMKSSISALRKGARWFFRCFWSFLSWLCRLLS